MSPEIPYLPVCSVAIRTLNPLLCGALTDMFLEPLIWLCTFTHGCRPVSVLLYQARFPQRTRTDLLSSYLLQTASAWHSVGLVRGSSFSC